MTKLKMGMHNRITAERFHIIRGAVLGGMNDEEVMRRYEIRRTTLKYIKKSRTFYEYRIWTETLPAARKMPTVYGVKSGLAFEDYKPKRCEFKPLHKSAQAEEYCFSIIAILVLALVIISLLAITVIYKN